MITVKEGSVGERVVCVWRRRLFLLRPVGSMVQVVGGGNDASTVVQLLPHAVVHVVQL